MSPAERRGLSAQEADAHVKALTPLWRTASRAEAVAILGTAREITDSLIDGVSAKRMAEIGPLGGGVWSITDLIGHLATWEERALVILGVRTPPASEEPRTTDEFNAFHIERKRAWSSARVRKDAAGVQRVLMDAIADTSDDR